MPPSPGSHNSALPQNQAQQGGAASQPGHPLDTEIMPMEDGFVHTEGSGSPLRGQAAERTDAQSNLAPSDLAEVKDLNTSKPSVDKGLPLDGGPALSAFKGHPKMTDASQKAPLPESKGETSGQEKKVPVSVKQTGTWQQGMGYGDGLCLVGPMSPHSLGLAPWTGQDRAPLSVTSLWLVPTEVRARAFCIIDTMTQGLDGFCFFQPIDAAASPVKTAGKETEDVRKPKPSPVSPVASKDGDQVEAWLARRCPARRCPPRRAPLASCVSMASSTCHDSPVFTRMSCARQSLSPWSSHAREKQEGRSSLRRHGTSPGRVLGVCWLVF